MEVFRVKEGNTVYIGVKEEDFNTFYAEKDLDFKGSKTHKSKGVFWLEISGKHSDGYKFIEEASKYKSVKMINEEAL